MPSRAERVCGGREDLRLRIEELVELSLRGLEEMYLPERARFVHTRRGRREARPEGESLRYSAIVALGAQRSGPAAQRRMLGGRSAAEYCDQLSSALPGHENLGDVALITWAMAEAGQAAVDVALSNLRERVAACANPKTVELAWVLSAFSAAAPLADCAGDARDARDQLLRSGEGGSGLFAHWVRPREATRLRHHVSCFADQVYPIQALARHHARLGDPEGLSRAATAARRICELQGAAGQWWWHYDWRTGAVLERYPVYTVHQDAMAPMALLDLEDAGGPDLTEAIGRGLDWMVAPPERRVELVDSGRGLIWRKVARAEPLKASRRIRAALSLAHPDLRARWLDTLFPPRSVDWESRPYHLGWILYAWQPERRPLSCRPCPNSPEG